jgi:hypothetical protein
MYTLTLSRSLLYAHTHYCFKLHCSAQGEWCRDSPAGADAARAAAAEADMQHWFGAAEAALAVLFRHGAAPEEACAAVVRHIAATALGESQPSSGASPLALARLCFVLGHSALKLLVYSEDLASRLKRAKGGGAKQQVKAAAESAAAAAAAAASASSKPAAGGRKKSQKKKQAADSDDADNSADEVSTL